MSEEVIPYKEKSGTKKEQVAEMFDNISHRYDFLNHFLSLGIDKLWRKKAIGLLAKDQPKLLLDVATGTGDFALEALKLNPDRVYGIDISKGMLSKGKEKIKKLGHDDKINLDYGDSENIPFDSDFFDGVTVAFGVRNFENLNRGLSEIKRVLKPGAKAIILEFSKPKQFPVKQLYHFYFHTILPQLGKRISKDSAAYSYLPESVNAFPEGEDFEFFLRSLGYKVHQSHRLMFGIASIYVAEK